MLNKHFLRIGLICFIAIAYMSCDSKNNQTAEADEIIEYEDFNYENSDMTAIELAEEVLEQAGGQEHWDQTKYIGWNFFGNTRYWWDKTRNRIRVESLVDSSVVVFNANDQTGKVFLSGKEIIQPDSASLRLAAAKKSWENDSYWVLMPFQLFSRNSTLLEGGVKNDMNERPCDIVEVEPGHDPGAKYEVFIDQETRRVAQWAYFKQKEDEDPSMVMPWTDWEKYGNLWLAAGRGTSVISEYAVTDTIPEDRFTNPNITKL